MAKASEGRTGGDGRNPREGPRAESMHLSPLMFPPYILPVFLPLFPPFLNSRPPLSPPHPVPLLSNRGCPHPHTVSNHQQLSVGCGSLQEHTLQSSRGCDGVTVGRRRTFQGSSMFPFFFVVVAVILRKEKKTKQTKNQTRLHLYFIWRFQLGVNPRPLCVVFSHRPTVKRKIRVPSLCYTLWCT